MRKRRTLGRFGYEQTPASYKPLRKFPHSGILNEVRSDRPTAPIFEGYGRVFGHLLTVKVYCNVGQAADGSNLWTWTAEERDE